MQRVAIIDIGSNSARLVIINIYGNKAYNMIFNQKEALRLSQKIDVFGNFTKEAFQETMDTMHSFAYMCKLYQAERIVAVATAAIRTARNGSDLVAAMHSEGKVFSTEYVEEGTLLEAVLPVAFYNKLESFLADR